MLKHSFTLRVLAISFLVLALPLLVDSFIFFQSSYSASIDDAKSDLQEAANFRTFSLSEIQPVKQVLLRELEYMFNLQAPKSLDDPEKFSHELSQIAQAGGSFQIFLLSLGEDDVYKVVASSLQSLVDTDFISYIKFADILKVGEGTFIRYIYKIEENRYVPFVLIARAIIDKTTGKPLGLILITDDIEAQLNTVVATNKKHDSMRFAILNLDGVALAATDKSLIGNYFDPVSKVRRKEIMASSQIGTHPLPVHQLPIIEGSDPPFFEFIYDDQLQIAYRAHIPKVGISIVAYSSKEGLFGSAVRHFLLIYSIYGLILVVGGGVTYWLSLWISRPLRQLTNLMGEVSRGNLDVRFEREPLGFEINILGGIFNNTLVNLLDNIQHAEDERVKKETYQRELAIGRQVQRSLLPPTVPEIQGAELAATYLPAAEVGGDFYTYLSRRSKSGEEILVLTVADAAGKGISPCLYALSARSLLRTHATLLDDPGEILSCTNNSFMEDTGDTGMFVTMFTGIYHADSKILSYYSCGHVPPLVRRADGHIVTLEHSGMALGLQESKGYATNSIKLQSGDLVIFYTDGLTEVFPEKRMRSCLQQRNWLSAQEAVDGLVYELQDFMAEEEVVIIALKVN